jgi:hypothetical protein
VLAREREIFKDKVVSVLRPPSLWIELKLSRRPKKKRGGNKGREKGERENEEREEKGMAFIYPTSLLLLKQRILNEFTTTIAMPIFTNNNTLSSSLKTLDVVPVVVITFKVLFATKVSKNLTLICTFFAHILCHLIH